MHRMSKKTAEEKRRVFRGIASGLISMARFRYGNSGRMPHKHGRGTDNYDRET